MTETSREPIGPESIIYRPEWDGSPLLVVNCKGVIRADESKAIYEVTWNGEPAIAKCWSEEWYRRYPQEMSVYDRLDIKRPQGYDFFASILSHGHICCSSLLPKGYILVMTKAQGEPLTLQWSTLPESAKRHIRSEVYKAIKVIRELSLVCLDAGLHNVLYDRETNAVTMVDLELMQPVEPETVSPDLPAMYAIFREKPVQGSVS
ncbi:hypothetical protein AbraIFM66950_001178 [Aspergillus brasiliensis]|nr:hypothetical protein AbraIFM66950_001178 [Aspergillus brasiliensis]